MLEIRDIRKTFNPGTVNEKIALNGVSLHLKPGDFVTVIGGNGAGKSTLLNSVSGALEVDEGQILNVATSPLYRRMGCAKLVMRFLCEYADTHRLSTLSLEVRASNTAAISLYEACGFLRVGVRRGFYKNPVEDAYVMLRQSPSANHHF